MTCPRCQAESDATTMFREMDMRFRLQQAEANRET